MRRKRETAREKTSRLNYSHRLLESHLSRGTVYT